MRAVFSTLGAVVLAVILAGMLTWIAGPVVKGVFASVSTLGDSVQAQIFVIMTMLTGMGLYVLASCWPLRGTVSTNGRGWLMYIPLLWAAAYLACMKWLDVVNIHALCERLTVRAANLPDIRHMAQAICDYDGPYHQPVRDGFAVLFATSVGAAVLVYLLIALGMRTLWGEVRGGWAGHCLVLVLSFYMIPALWSLSMSQFVLETLMVRSREIFPWLAVVVDGLGKLGSPLLLLLALVALGMQVVAFYRFEKRKAV